MTPAPKPGTCPACGMKALIRKIGAGVVADARLRFAGKYPYTSYQLPKNIPGLPTDRAGNVVIESPRAEREVMSGRYTGGHRYVRT